jgi:radical SAM-linked protein
VDARSGRQTGEPRQRWRIVFAREAVTAVGSSNDQLAWAAALSDSHVPVALSGTIPPRPRFVLAAPLPVRVAGERELADVFLTERLRRADLWGHLAGHLPPGVRLVDLHDVWIGERTLTAQLGAADHRLAIRGAQREDLERACAALLASGSLDRARDKGDGRSVAYDLRPLVLDLRISARDVVSAADSGTPTVVGSPTHDGSDARAAPVTAWMRLRQAPDGPSGRPDEVVRALAEVLDRPLEIETHIRERLLTADDLAPRDGPRARPV